MQVTFHFFSYFKDLTGCASGTETLPDGSTLGDLQQALFVKFPKLEQMRNSTLIAVGMDYQRSDYMLKDGDEVSLFPPVQGG